MYKIYIINVHGRCGALFVYTYNIYREYIIPFVYCRRFRNYYDPKVRNIYDHDRRKTPTNTPRRDRRRRHAHISCTHAPITTTARNSIIVVTRDIIKIVTARSNF